MHTQREREKVKTSNSSKRIKSQIFKYGTFFSFFYLLQVHYFQKKLKTDESSLDQWGEITKKP